MSEKPKTPIVIPPVQALAVTAPAAIVEAATPGLSNTLPLLAAEKIKRKVSENNVLVKAKLMKEENERLQKEIAELKAQKEAEAAAKAAEEKPAAKKKRVMVEQAKPHDSDDDEDEPAPPPAKAERKKKQVVVNDVESDDEPEPPKAAERQPPQRGRGLTLFKRRR